MREATAAKVCPECGCVFNRADLGYPVANATWHARRFCSESCRRHALAAGKLADGQRSPEQTKQCERCGTTFGRGHGRARVDDHHWSARRFCDDGCRLAWFTEEARRRSGPNHPSFTGTSIAGGRRRARALFPLTKCERCGELGEVRHHVDENPLNNSPGNVQILCRACHLLVHDPLAVRWARTG